MFSGSPIAVILMRTWYKVNEDPEHSVRLPPHGLRL